MKLGIIAIVAGLTMMLASIAFSQVPGVINYQARLTDANGAPLENDPATTNDGWINLQFRIYNATGGGTFVWSQETTNVAVYNGLFSVLLSNLNATVFPATNRVNRWLEVEVITNGVSSILAPRKDFSSVPYALRAGDADTVDGLHANELGGITNETDPQVDDNNLGNNRVPRWNGSALVGGTIFDDGNVGLGTPNPSEKLDIQGGRLRIGNTMIDDNEINRYLNDNLYIGYRTTANTILQLNNGNVGVGTAEPNAGLDISRAGGWGSLVIRNSYAGSHTHFNLGEKNYIRGTTVIADTGGNVGVGTRTPAAKLDVNGDSIVRGKVGIGTDDPNAGLDISHAGGWGSLVIRNSYAGGITFFDHPEGKNYIRGTTVISDTGGTYNSPDFRVYGATRLYQANGTLLPDQIEPDFKVDGVTLFDGELGSKGGYWAAQVKRAGYDAFRAGASVYGLGGADNGSMTIEGNLFVGLGGPGDNGGWVEGNPPYGHGIGNIRKTGSVQFYIVHPVDTNKFLVHTAIESPLAELIYRGKAQLSNGVAVVNLNTYYGLIPHTLDSILTNLSVVAYNNASWTRVRCPAVSGVSFLIEAEATNCNDVVEWIAIGKRIGANVSDEIELDK